MTPFKEIKRNVKEWCLYLCANKLDNLDEIDEFLEIHNLPRVNHEEIETLNRLVLIISNTPPPQTQNKD